jgi:hypothetical protein
LARSSTPGRRRPGAAPAGRPRAAGSTATPVGAPSLEDATRPRAWQDLALRPLADVLLARPLFEYAALPWPEPDAVALGWGAAAAASDELVGAVLAERGGRALFLHGPIVRIDRIGTTDPLQLAAQLLAPVLTHGAALGADTVFTRPQGLDRVWIRFGFIPVPESALPAAFAGRPGAGLYGWRGGSALWTLREPPGDATAA